MQDSTACRLLMADSSADDVLEVHHYWTSIRDGHPERMAHVTLGIEQLDGTLDPVELSLPINNFVAVSVAA